MAKGDAALAVSMVVVVVGTGLFVGGMGTGRWVEDRGHRPHLHYYGLWRVCHVNASTSPPSCISIAPGFYKAYFEATRTLVCVALVMYAVTLLSCFTAEDGDARQSVRVCVRRYLHVLAAFAAGGLTFVATLIFATCYKDDDWFTQPVLGHSYWLTLAGFVCVTAGGVMRVVFIAWPQRPVLPVRKKSRLQPTDHSVQKKKKKKTPRVQSSVKASSDPPVSTGVSSQNGDEHEHVAIKEKQELGMRRFLAKWQQKTSTDASTVRSVYDAVNRTCQFNVGLNPALDRSDVSDAVSDTRNIQAHSTVHASRAAASSAQQRSVDEAKITSQGKGNAGGGSSEKTSRSSRTHPSEQASAKHVSKKSKTHDSDQSHQTSKQRRRRRRSGEVTTKNVRTLVKKQVLFEEPGQRRDTAERRRPDDSRHGQRQKEGVAATADSIEQRDNVIVTRYELVVDPQDFRSRVVSRPPAVVYPASCAGV